MKRNEDESLYVSNEEWDIIVDGIQGMVERLKADDTNQGYCEVYHMLEAYCTAMLAWYLQSQSEISDEDAVDQVHQAAKYYAVRVMQGHEKVAVEEKQESH